MADSKVLEPSETKQPIEEYSSTESLLQELTQVKSLLNTPSDASECIDRVHKLAEYFLDSKHLEEISTYPNFKDINVHTLIIYINTYRTEKRTPDVLVRFLTHILSVCENCQDFKLEQSTSEELVTLSRELSTQSARDEHVVKLLLLSCLFIIRETSPPEHLLTGLLTSCSDLYFSFSDLSNDNLALLLTVLNEFATKLTKVFAENFGFESMPLLLLIIHENTHSSVCTAACKLIKNVFSITPEMKLEFDFPVLMEHLKALLELHPRDVHLTSQIVLAITNYIASRRDLVAELADPNHHLFLFCTQALQDDTCPIELQFGLCPFIAVLILSLQQDQLTFIARLLLKCIDRAKQEKKDLSSQFIAALVSITFTYPQKDLLKTAPVEYAEPLLCSLTYSDYLELLGLTLCHNSTDPTIALQSIGTLSNVIKRNRNLKYPATLLKGLRGTLVHIHKLGEKDVIMFILKLIYGIDKDDLEQAEAMVESEIASGLTECLSEEADINTIMLFITVITGLIACYSKFFKDVKQLNDPIFHNTFLNLFFRPTSLSTREGLHEGLGFCFLNLSCDKQASKSMYEYGAIPKMIEFIANKESSTPSSFRAVVHSLANIGIHCTKARTSMLDHHFHIVLIDTFRHIADDPKPDWQLYCACIRGIQIIASGDQSKHEILNTDIISVIVRILSSNPSFVEAIWRSLACLASLSYIAKQDRGRFFTKELFEVVSYHMKQMGNGKVFGYGCFFFLSISENDLGARYTGGMQLDEAIFTVISNPILMNDMEDLARWCFDCLDKFVCHIAPLQLSSPPIPDYTLPNNIDNFVVHRHFGRTRHFCSNCDTETQRSEVVLRNDAVTLEQYQLLVNNGWYRRGGDKMFRFNTQHRKVCMDWETRVRVKEFDVNSSKTFKRVLKKVPKEVVVETVPARLTQEGCDLYNRYHLDKHDKPAKLPSTYAEHAVDSPLKVESRDGVNYGTYHQEYRLNGKLIAIGVIDVILEGVVSVYFYYDMSKEVAKMSLGVYSSLKEIEFVANLNKINPAIKYYYIQGWNGPNLKLAYKSNYKPIEFCAPCFSPYWSDSIDIPYIQSGFLPPLQEGNIPKELTTIDSTHPNLLSDTENVYHSIDIDRSYMREVHQISVDGSKVRVFLNGEIITCEELLDRFKIYSETKQFIFESMEELALALGPSLCHKLLVVFKLSEQVPCT